MLVNYTYYAVVAAMQRFLDDNENQIHLVGAADYDHIFALHETLTNLHVAIRPTSVTLDHSELLLLSDYLIG